MSEAERKLKVLRERMSDASQILNGAIYEIEFKNVQGKAIYEKFCRESILKANYDKALRKIEELEKHINESGRANCILSAQVDFLESQRVELLEVIMAMEKKD